MSGEIFGANPPSLWISKDPLPGGDEAAAPPRPDCWTLLLLITIGTLLVAVAYFLGRHHVNGATAPYWFGQTLILLPTALTNVSRSADVRERVVSLVATAAAQSFLTWCYSPDQFRVGDELQHVVTAHNILTTHHLYTPNLALPVSPSFPGLEIATTALVNVTGLSMFHAGVIIVSTCHILVPIAVFLFFLELTVSTRLAGAAAFVYTLAPHYSYFDTLFVYGAPGIAFVMLVLWAAARGWRRRSNPMWVVVAFAPLVVTHHASAVVGLVLLAALAAAIGFSGSWHRGLLLALGTLLIADDVVAWFEVHAPETFSYLWRPIASSFSHPQTGAAPATTVSTAPIWEHYAAEVAALAMLLLILVGIWQVWKPNAPTILRAFSLLGIGYVGVLGIRLTSSDGTELSGRSLSYAMVAVALPVSIALAWLWTRSDSRRGKALVLGTLVLLLVGQIVTSLPAARQRIPGQPAIDARATALEKWAAATWDPNLIAICSQDACPEMTSIYTQAQILTSGTVYRRSVSEANDYLRALKVSYVETDSRNYSGTASTANQPLGDTARRAGSPAARFDSDPELDRVYDDGEIHVYYARRTW